MKKVAVTKMKLSAAEEKSLLDLLKGRFLTNMHRHKAVEWEKMHAKLQASPEKLVVLNEMEKTGGEPDVIGTDKKTGEYLFYDCSMESPAGRRSVCFDKEGWQSRKEARPENTAMEMASEIGIEILDEEEYRALQKVGKFDAKTSSWLKTPPGIRKLGGAIFGDFRYETVFIYHNGAQSYYAARGFRGCLKV